MQTLRFDKLSELARKGEDFCLPVVVLADLPVKYFPAKPDFCF
jgi:hypothetical protein